MGTGWQALRCFSRTGSCHIESPQGQSWEAGSPTPSPSQRSPPWSFPPPTRGHTHLAAAQLESAWRVRVRTPGQAMPMPDREEVEGAAWESRKEAPRETRRPVQKRFGQRPKSTLSSTAQAAATSTWHLCHPGTMCAWPVLGSQGCSPCHPAMPAQSQRGDRSETA